VRRASIFRTGWRFCATAGAPRTDEWGNVPTREDPRWLARRLAACFALLVSLVAAAPAQADDPIFDRAFGAGPADLCTSSCRAGQNGSGAAQFSFATSVAAGGGELFVADQANHRVAVYATDGTFLRAFGRNVNLGAGNPDLCTIASTCRAGTAGGAAGQLSSPYAVAVSGGEVYVADASNNRVSVFSTSGSFARAFGKGVNPAAGDPDVCTAATSCRAGTQGSGTGQLSFPLGVAVGGGEVFVADSSNTRISVFSTAGTYARSFGGAGAGAGQLAYPFGVAYAAGEVYVADQNNHRIAVFAADGTFARAFGKNVNAGAGAPDVCTTLSTCRIGTQSNVSGALNRPQGVTVSAGEVYVGDGSHRINVFLADGTFARGIAKGVNAGSGNPDVCTTACQGVAAAAGAGQLSSPVGLAVSDGEVFVADSGNYRVSAFSTAGAFARAFGKSVWGASPFVCTFATGCSGGAAGGAAAQLNLPLGVAVGGGEVYVADGTNHRVTVYSTSGVFQRAFGRNVNAGTGNPDVCTLLTSCRSGTGGAGAGQLFMPAAVAVAGGEVYVADQNNHRVTVFASDGTFLRAFGRNVNPGTGDPNLCTTACQSGSVGGAAGQLDNPVGIAISGGEAYVTDQGNRRISVFATDGTFARAFGKAVNPGTGNPDVCTPSTTCRFGTAGSAAGQLNSPYGVTVSGGEVYVADYLNSRISVFATTGTFARAFGKAVNAGTGAPDVCVATCRAGSTGGAAGQISFPYGVAVGDGAVYVSDRFNARLSVFGTDGAFQRAFGKLVNAGTGSPDVCTAITTCRAAAAGDAAGQFMEPVGVAMTGTTIYVTERLSNRISVYRVPRTEITADPVSLGFGPRDIDDGPTATQSSTITNTGTEQVTLTGLTLAGDSAHFTRLTGVAGDCAAATSLSPGQTCTVRVHFDPSTTGAKTATLTISSNAPNITVALTGTATQTELSRVPPSLTFAARDIDDGAGAVQSSTVTNTGTEAVSISGLTLSGDSAHFARLTGTAADCSTVTTLTAGQTCTVRVVFDPLSIGAKTATLSIASNATPLTVALSGTGIQTELSRAPATLDFGARDIDEGPATLTSTVTNSGSEPITLNTVTLSGDTTQFTRQTGSPGDCAAALTLTAGQTCALRIRFDPTSTGAKAATVAVTSNAAPISVAATGSGTQTELARTPSTLPFGNRDLDAAPSAVLTSTIANIGSEVVEFSAITLAGDADQFEWMNDSPSDCTATTDLAPAQTCTLRFRFDPTTIGTKAASVSIVSNAPTATVNLTGRGVDVAVSWTPASLAFGTRDVDTGATTIRTSTVTNTGADTITLSALTLAGDGSHFTRVGDAAGDCNAGTQLAAGESCTLRLRFDPSSIGAKSATLSVTSNAPTATVALSGSGIQTRLASNPPRLDFGAHDLDEGPVHQTATIANVGSERVTVGGIAVSGEAPHYERLTGARNDCSSGTQLDAGETCEVRMRFDPTTMGAKPGAVTVTSNAPAVVVDLSGSGTSGLVDSDGDGTPDIADTDDDNDGYPDDHDAFPLDPSRHAHAAPAPPAPVTPAARTPAPRPWRLKRTGRPKITVRRGVVTVLSGYTAICGRGTAPCSGRFTLKWVRRSPRTRKVVRVFLTGKARPVTIAPGKRRRLAFRLNERGMKILQRRGTLRAVLRGALRVGTLPARARRARIKLVTPA
jgi:DNA-binding beta-propeller fold protein YncE